MKHRIFLLLFAGALLAGCAGPRPLTLTCSVMGTSPVVEPGRPIDLGIFSVNAPEGDGWCRGPRGPGLAVFTSHPLMGRYIEKPEPSMGRNTIVLQARRLKHGAAGLNNTDDLKRFVEVWIERGHGANASGSEPIKSEAAARFTLVRESVRPWRSLDADCVRFEYVMEERDNPIAPGKVLILSDDGVVCRHPTARDYVLLLALSERYEQGKQIDPGLFERLQGRYGEPFFKSLKFAQAD